MHQAAESLGQAFLLRGESGDASVDLSLAEYRTRHRENFARAKPRRVSG
jgi:hypothetical protein